MKFSTVSTDLGILITFLFQKGRIRNQFVELAVNYEKVNKKNQTLNVVTKKPYIYTVAILSSATMVTKRRHDIEKIQFEKKKRSYWAIGHL